MSRARAKSDLRRTYRKAVNAAHVSASKLSASLNGAKRAEAPLVLVGTHHKTGTIWMGSIFHRLANRLGRVYYTGPASAAPGHVDIFVQNNSAFPADYLQGLNANARPWRGLHIIRDPRDVIVSGCFYHQKSTERWLHRPQEAFGGRTYQEAINALPALEDKLLFEMENRGRETIRRMMAWNYAQPNFIEVKYETIIVDTDLAAFTSIFTHLGFEGQDLSTALEVARKNSLFGEAAARPRSKAHVRSGEAQQWRALFTPRLIERFKTLFPSALTQLGYEADEIWTA